LAFVRSICLLELKPFAKAVKKHNKRNKFWLCIQAGRLAGFFIANCLILQGLIKTNNGKKQNKP